MIYRGNMETRMQKKHLQWFSHIKGLLLHYSGEAVGSVPGYQDQEIYGTKSHLISFYFFKWCGWCGLPAVK